jgi:hypothetical protein
MSALRTAAAAAAKHTRTLSQPLRRTFYTPYAALQYSTTKSTTTIDEAVPTAHEHEREHAARTVHVVAEPNTADLKFYGVPMGAYPNATPYHHHQYPAAYATPAVELENANVNVSLVSAVLIILYAYIFLLLMRATVLRITAGIDDASASPCSHLCLIPCWRARDGEDGLGLVMTWLVGETLGLQ